MYVKGASKKDKDDWKERKGIERKTQDKSKRKTQNTAIRKQHTKSRDQQVKEVTLALEINKLKQNGLSIRKIAKELNVSINTVQKYIIK